MITRFYISKNELPIVNESMRGSFEGIGVNFFFINDTVSIIRVLKGSPAEKFGLIAGDRILMSDRDTLYGKNLSNQKILDKIYLLDPAGIGAKDLQQCLLLQLKRKKINKNVSNATKIIKDLFDEFSKRREIIIELLSKIPGIKLNKPSGAFYVFPDVSSYFGKVLNGKKIKNATDFALYLLEIAHVATVTGEAFGNGNCIRISYAASEEKIRLAIERISSALK